MAKRQELLPDAEVADKAREILDRMKEPTAPSKLSKELKGGYRRSEKQLVDLLEAEVAAGRVHRFAPQRGATSRYWTRDLATYGRQVFLENLAKPKTGSALETAVAKRLKELSKAQRQEMLEQLIDAGQVYRLPPMGSSKTPRYSVQPPDPAEYVRKPVLDLRKKIEKIAKDLAACGIPVERTLGVALETFRGKADVPRTPIQPAPASMPAVTEAAADDFDSAFDAAFAELDRQKGSHNLVSLVDLRRSLSRFSKDDFDRGLRQLRAASRYGLSAAESIDGVRPEQREAGIEEAGALLLHVSRK